MRGTGWSLPIFILLPLALGEIQFEMSILTEVNESAFMDNVAVMSRRGVALSNKTNTTTLLPEVALSRAKISLGRLVNILCIEKVGCYNDTETLSPPPSPTIHSLLAAALLIGGGSGVLIGILAYWLTRPRPAPPKSIKVTIDLPRNRGWVMR